MSIDATHWAYICAAVQRHAEKLYPNDMEKQRELTEELLCSTSSETLLRRGAKADAALKRLQKPTLKEKLRSWLKQLDL